MSFPRNVATGLTYLASSAMAATGTIGMMTPLWFARNVFGTQQATEETIAFYPGVAGRNIATGLALFTLMYNGQRTAAGTVLFFGTLAGLSDVYLLMIRDDARGTWLHMFNTVWACVLGWDLMSGN